MPRPHPARMRGHAPACITSLHEVPGSRLLCSGVAWRTSAAARATRGAAAAWSGTRTTGTRTLPRRHTRPQAARAKRGRGRRTRRTPPGRPTRSPGRRQGRLQSAGQRPQAHPSRSRASRTSRPCAPSTGPPSSATSAACVRRGCQQPRPAAGWPPGLQPDDILALDWSSALAAGEGMCLKAPRTRSCACTAQSRAGTPWSGLRFPRWRPRCCQAPHRPAGGAQLPPPGCPRLPHPAADSAPACLAVAGVRRSWRTARQLLWAALRRWRAPAAPAQTGAPFTRPARATGPTPEASYAPEVSPQRSSLDLRINASAPQV